MHRALVGNLDQPLALIALEVAFNGEMPVDYVVPATEEPVRRTATRRTTQPFLAA